MGKEFVTWPSRTTAVKEAVWLGGKGAELVIRLPRVQALHPTMHWICSCLPQVHLLYCALYNVYNLSASCQLGFLNLYWPWKAHWESGQLTLHTNIHARSGQGKIPLEWKSPKEYTTLLNTVRNYSLFISTQGSQALHDLPLPPPL